VDGRDYLWKLSRQQEGVLDVGTVVQHATADYIGVVVGYDDVCRRTDEWCLLTGVDDLPNGRNQPFYHVMVDSGTLTLTLILTPTLTLTLTLTLTRSTAARPRASPPTSSRCRPPTSRRTLWSRGRR